MYDFNIIQRTEREVDSEKKIYDLKQLLEISKSLCTTIELDKLIEAILYISMAQMRVLSAGIFIKKDYDCDYFSLNRNFAGFDLDSSIIYEIESDSNIAKFLQEANSAYTLNDLEIILGESDELSMLKSLNPTLIIPLVLKNNLMGIMVLGERILIEDNRLSYNLYEREEIFTLASLSAIAINNAFLIDQAATDMMTGLKIRHFFFNILADRMAEAKNNNETVGVLMIDIDHFKKFNDSYGHACGDYVLQRVAKTIKESIRSCDLASRYGGEEFTVMIIDSNREEIIGIAQRILTKISANSFYYQSKKMKVTVSIGIALYDPMKDEDSSKETATQLVSRADSAMYVSKRNGRNGVTFDGDVVIISNQKGKAKYEHNKKAV